LRSVQLLSRMRQQDREEYNEKGCGLTMATPPLPARSEPWYRGVTRYQWLVLAIASAGWVFDVFEGQIRGPEKTGTGPLILEVLSPFCQDLVLFR